jgi:hypothetical protein
VYTRRQDVTETQLSRADFELRAQIRPLEAHVLASRVITQLPTIKHRITDRKLAHVRFTFAQSGEYT